MMKKLLIIFTILLLPCLAFGAVDTHYATQSGAGDQNGTSLANAWAVSDFNTIDNWDIDVADDNKIGPGDTVFFSGDISTKIEPQKSGTSGNRITLDGYETDDTTYKDLSESSGRAKIDVPGDTNAGMLIDALGYFNVVDFEVTDCTTGIRIYNGANHITLQRNYIYECFSKGFTVSYSHGDNPNYITIGGSDGHGNVVKNCGFDTSDMDVKLCNAEDIIVSYNHLYGSTPRVWHAGEEAYFSCDGIQLGCGQTTNVLIEYNTIHGHNGSAGENAMDFKPTNSNVIVRYNKIYDEQGEGEGSVIMNMGSQYIYFYGNWLNDSKNGIVITNKEDFQDTDYIYVWSNIITNMSSCGVKVVRRDEPGDVAYPGDHLYFYNNTLAFNGDENDADKNETAMYFSQGESAVKNNIFYYNQPNVSTYYHWIEKGNDESGTHTGDNNVAILTDSTANWTADEFIGVRVFNTTDGSEGYVTDNDTTTITASLSGGTDNDWDTNDAYYISPGRIKELEHNTYYWPAQTSKGFVDWTDPDDIVSVADMQNDWSWEDDTETAPAGEDADPGLIDPDNDDYTLDGNNINDGEDLSEQFNVVIQGTTYTFDLQDGLDEDTDWSTTPPTVSTVNRDSYKRGTSYWDRGAYVYGSSGSESNPPIPNPATFATAPAAIVSDTGPEEMDMTSTTGTDANTIEYSFDFDPNGDSCGSHADIGTGGTDSGWLSETTYYKDEGLQPNQYYCYKVQMRDSLGNTGTASSLAGAYTSPWRPKAMTVENIADTTAEIANFDPNSNPATNPTTLFAIKCTGSAPTDSDWQNKWIQADGSAGASEVWQSEVQWETETISGLNPSAKYYFAGKAKNEEDVESDGLGTGMNFTTTGTPVSPPMVTTEGGIMTGGVYQ